MKLYILAAGKSSRFASPKILKSYPLNYELFDKYFDEIIIATSDQIYNALKVLEKYPKTSLTILNGEQFGSGDSVWNLHKLVNVNEYCLAWSDAIFNEENVTSMINATETSMAISYVKNAYVNIKVNNGYASDFSRGGIGYQDCSIFKIFSSYFANICKQNDFMDYLHVKPMRVVTNKNLALYFNTLEEFDKISKLLCLHN